MCVGPDYVRPLSGGFCPLLRARALPRLCSEYAYLMKMQRSIPGVDDAKEFASLKESMSKVEIDAKDQVK